MRDDPNGSIDPHRRTQNKKPCRSQWPMLRRNTAPDAAASVIRQVRQGTEASSVEIFFCIRRARPRLQIHFSDKIVQDLPRSRPRGKATGTAHGRRKRRRPSETGRPFPPVCRRRNLPFVRKATDALLRIKLQSMDNDTNFSWIPPVRKKADSISIFMDSAAASFSPVQQSSVIPSPPVPGPPHERAAISGPPCGRHKMSKLPHKACTASGKA